MHAVLQFHRHARASGDPALFAGHAGAPFDACLIEIGEGDQFGSGFVVINRNSKMPALLDRYGPQPIRVFESGAMLVSLVEKYGACSDASRRPSTPPEIAGLTYMFRSYPIFLFVPRLL